MTALLERRLRPATAAPFRQLLADVGADLRETTASMASGQIGVEEWGGIVLETLAHGHAQAAYLGRVRAGDGAPFDQDDERFGALVAQEEQPFLQGFAADLAAGRYQGEDGGFDHAAAGKRLALYVARLHGTANEALALTAGDEEAWTWTRGKKDSCASCVTLEANSPYSGLPPTLPRMGQTECLSNCGCRCVSSSGLETFSPE
jgi:hypothetical protein